MSNHWLYRTLHPVSLREDPVGLVLITPLCMAMALIHYMKARNDQDGVLASDDNQTDVGLGPESSAQKKAFSKSLDYFLDQLPVGIAIKDVRHDYAVIHWNKKIERMFGIPKESILGRNYSMLTNELDEDWVVHSRTMAHLASKKGKPLERTKETVITKHGKRSFDVLRFEVQGQDRNEHLLVGLYKESSFEIEKDYNAVAKEKLFQRIINHDIRNALNDLIGLPDLIFDHLDAGNNTRVKNMLDEIDKKAKSLTVFMDEIPDKGLNRMGLPHEQALINIRELVEEGILFFDEISRVKNTTILNKVDSNINMKLDGYAFRLVLRNLLSNAVKFSHSKSTIHVESRETEDELILTVVDHGVGIAPDKLSKIFDSYEGKSTPGTAGERGSGIGLSLLKQLLELEGDTIKIESTLNVGTKVTVHFQKFT
ncbi:MAG: PAS domain-containing sensor histidine kinase [Cyclobacteriaceae bacterium]